MPCSIERNIQEDRAHCIDNWSLDEFSTNAFLGHYSTLLWWPDALFIKSDLVSPLPRSSSSCSLESIHYARDRETEYHDQNRFYYERQRQRYQSCYINLPIWNSLFMCSSQTELEHFYGTGFVEEEESEQVAYGLSSSFSLLGSVLSSYTFQKGFSVSQSFR